MNKHLVIHTLCEGVETKEQADFLRAIGCDRLQGFYFSKPLPQEEMLALIEKNGLDHYEPQEMNDYYDTIGETNILVNPMVSHISQGIKHLEMPLTLIERRTGDQLGLLLHQFCLQGRIDPPPPGQLPGPGHVCLLDQQFWSLLRQDEKTRSKKISTRTGADFLHAKFLLQSSTRPLQRRSCIGRGRCPGQPWPLDAFS